MRWPSPPALLPLLSQMSQVSRHSHPILYFCSLNYTGIEITRTARTLGQACGGLRLQETVSLPSMSMLRDVSSVFRLTLNLLSGSHPHRAFAVERVMLRVTPTLLLACVIACGSDLPSEPTGLEAAQTLPTVTRVIEGVGTVRLIGVDTPETVDPRRPVQYFGMEASDFTKQLATGKRVRLEFDQDRTDRYGRTLAYLYLQPDNLLLNAEIIRRGYGFPYTQFPFRMMEQFRALEREAREAGRGLWAMR